MTNSINVTRELLENLIEQHITAHGCTTETARQAQLMLSAPVQQVSVPDGWRELAKAVTALDQVPRSSGHAMPKPEQVRAEAAVIRAARAMLTAYPAAPAADAGLVAVEWEKDAEEWGPALNGAGWLFLSELNEDSQKSALIFNNCKGPLRAAIMKYAEIVTARRAAAELKQINNYGD